MRRTKIMTIGFVLIFMGIQLNLVESYELTPRFSNFFHDYEDASNYPSATLNQPYSSNYYQTSFQNPDNQRLATLSPTTVKTITPPSWYCWPVLFFGTVMVLHGFAKRQN